VIRNRSDSNQERTKWLVETKVLNHRFRIIPGDRGKIEPGWLARSLESAASAVNDEAGFTSSSGSVRALPVTRKKELGDKE
jgi:hypothetical protein